MSPIYIAVTVVCCAVFIALVIAFIAFSNKALQVTKYSAELKNAPERQVRIVLLSDLHAAEFGKGNKRLLRKVEEQSPDIIAFTGDLIHKYRERDIAVAKRTVKSLAEIAPTYIVSGNHEMRNKRWRQFASELRDCGATVLENECVQTNGVSLCGVNCAFLKNETPFKVAGGAEGCKILLAHKPEYIDRYALAGYDLALCGHAHGGQWRLPFTKIGFYSPGQGLFPKYTCGVYSCGNMRQVISRGLGNSECPLRLFNRPEIVVVQISGRDKGAEKL